MTAEDEKASLTQTLILSALKQEIVTYFSVLSADTQRLFVFYLLFIQYYFYEPSGQYLVFSSYIVF